MASLSHPPHYLFPDYILSNPLLLDGLPTPLSSSSDGSSGAAGEVNNYLPMADYSTSFNNIDSMILPLDQYSSPDISSSTTAFFASSGGGDYSSNFWLPPPQPPSSSYPINSAVENWEINQAWTDGVGQDSTTLKVTRYSAEEKKHRIIRYLKKRSQRNFNKTIKYACRKNLADKRVRVRGRFAKNKNEVTSSDDDQYQTLAHNYHTVNIDQSCYNVSSSTTDESCYNVSSSTTDDLSSLQMKTAAAVSEEEWLQEAIASFMYYRILPDVASIS